MTARKARAKARGWAGQQPIQGSFAVLRMTARNGLRKRQKKKQIASLRCGMIARNAKATAKANTGVSPLRAS